MPPEHSFDSVISVTLDVMPRLGKHLFEDAETAAGPVGYHFDRRHDGAVHSTVKEPSGCTAVPPRTDIHVDHLAILIHGPVDISSTAGNLDLVLIDPPADADPVLGPEPLKYEEDENLVGRTPLPPRQRPKVEINPACGSLPTWSIHSVSTFNAADKGVQTRRICANSASRARCRLDLRYSRSAAWARSSPIRYRRR